MRAYLRGLQRDGPNAFCNGHPNTWQSGGEQPSVSEGSPALHIAKDGLLQHAVAGLVAQIQNLASGPPVPCLRRWPDRSPARTVAVLWL